MKIFFHRDFKKSYAKLRTSDKKKFDGHLASFAEDPFAAALGNHALHGKYRGYRSINIGGDLRAIYKIIGNDEYLSAEVGTHAKLYGE